MADTPLRPARTLLPAALALAAAMAGVGAGGCRDDTPPRFDGLVSAVADTPFSLRLGWTPAHDDETSAPFLEYRAFLADTPGGEDFGAPASYIFGTSGGVVGGLAPGKSTFVVVRATDGAGNMDANTVEKEVTTPPAGAPRSLRMDVVPLLVNQCTRAGQCHAPPTLQDAMDLSTAEGIYQSLVGQNAAEHPDLDRVKPGDSGQSYVVRKILGLVNGATDGERMPLASAGLPPLPDDEISVVREWIDEGALNN